MIFAAGLGTRLKPYTDHCPKAMVEVAGHPMIAHQLIKLRKAGFTRVVINVHHYAEQIIDYVNVNNSFGLDIAFSDERGQLLETGGGIRKALPLFIPDSPVLVHNVDIFSNADLATLYDVLDRNTSRTALCDECMAQFVCLDGYFREVLFDQINCCLAIFECTCMYYVENVVAAERFIF